MRTCDQVLTFQHRFSVSIMISTSRLSWEPFQPSGHTVVAFEAGHTVSWKGPQAGQGPVGPRMPAPVTPEPCTCPGTRVPLAAAKASVPLALSSSLCLPPALPFLWFSPIHIYTCQAETMLPPNSVHYPSPHPQTFSLLSPVFPYCLSL